MDMKCSKVELTSSSKISRRRTALFCPTMMKPSWYIMSASRRKVTKRMSLTLEIFKRVMHSSHLSLLEEYDIDELGLSTAAVYQHVVIHVPVRDLTLQYGLEDALALMSPDFEQVVTLVELLESVVQDLHLEDREVLSPRGHRVIGAVRLYAEQAKPYKISELSYRTEFICCVPRRFTLRRAWFLESC